MTSAQHHTGSKTGAGNYFEDFTLGQTIPHATPRTLTVGDASLYTALYGSRFALQSSDEFARAMGYSQSPLDDLLVFHTVFGKTVPDISLNAVANLGYADVRFLSPVFAGDTLNAVSQVIGLKENSSGTTGIVYVRSKGFNQHDTCVLDYVRWVMVNKRDHKSPAPAESIPALPDAVSPEALTPPPALTAPYDTDLSGSPHLWDDYEIGERIDHIDGMTVEEAEHQLATRLYQNTAKVHFDAAAAKETRFGKRLIYGGHVISLARALSFNGLANAQTILAINAGKHAAPLFAGDTVYAWSEVLDKAALSGRGDIGALRLRTIATKNQPTSAFPAQSGETTILVLDYWVSLPRRP